MIKKGFWIGVLALLLVLQMFMIAVPVNAAGKIQWGEVKKGVYDPLHPYTLVWSGDVLESGGLNLSDMQFTKDGKKADIVINQYGDMGASGILELEEKLEDPTDSDLAGYTNSVEIAQNKVYLVVLHDGSFAKIRIDRILLPTKVYFSYVLQTDSPDSQSGTGNSDIPTYYFEEGEAIKISWTAGPNDVKYDIYRSDNGKDYAQLTDFSLTETSFVDKYALAGHTYYYLVYAYDFNNQYRKTGPIRVVVKSKSESSSSKSKIILQIDNNTADINGNPKTLDVAPFIIDGRTMVPVRFVGEAFGAKVDWFDAEQRVTLVLDGNTIVLWINKSEAKVNGKTVYMDVPAQILNDRTMVPIRFVSENFNLQVEFDNATRVITITGAAAAQPDTTHTTDADLSYFFGTWSLWTPGGYNSFNPGAQYTSGADDGTITINSDGTYVWNSVMDGEITGVWKKTGKSTEMILVAAEGGKDWAAVKEADGKIRVWRYPGLQHVGTKVE